MQVINTNMGSLNAQRAISSVQDAQQVAMERLSSGKRVNRASDDAAGLAIAETMTSQIRGANQAVRNSNDAISLVQTTEGAMAEISDMLQRIRELKVQYENDTNNSTQRGYLDEEFEQLADEIGGVIEGTKFNGFNVLSGGTAAVSGYTGFSIQTGWESGDTMTVGIGATLQSTASITNVVGTITSATGAATATSLTSAQVTLTEIDAALDTINDARTKLGAQQNRLEHNIANLKNVSENVSAARSRIVDADFAAESAELSRTNVLQQAGMAMLSQANQAPQQVLSLLK